MTQHIQIFLFLNVFMFFYADAGSMPGDIIPDEVLWPWQGNLSVFGIKNPKCETFYPKIS